MFFFTSFTILFSDFFSHLVLSHFTPLKVEKTKSASEDDLSQGLEGQSDSNGQSSTPGLDSDHDYTVIGSSSPTHTEDR